jgi:hypothetical protein
MTAAANPVDDSDHTPASEISTCPQCGRRGWRLDQQPCMGCTEERQEAELAGVLTWQWERMILLRGNTRRTRETITVRLHPSAWPRNISFAGQEGCHSIMWLESYPHPAGVHPREQWDADHGWDDDAAVGSVPTIWRVQRTSRARSDYRGVHYCDRCLPAEFRPPAGLEPLVGGDAWSLHITGSRRPERKSS